MIIPFEKNNNCFNLINISLGHVNGTYQQASIRGYVLVLKSLLLVDVTLVHLARI